ncbi:MAG: PTS system mannose/fructose/sorbose family transporter subunit IID [Erysipelotrichaceae bacterium]|nr:PTS system mannose/fructose/sorbose family transporter subunit IID [Bacillota bacterium]HCY07037.1 PTS sugar transporter subunit IID [Erysipelotrichaceae bacterium]
MTQHGLLNKKDVTRAWAKYILSAEVASGFERLTALAFSYGMSDVLEKLYSHNPEEYKSALHRHLMFYNSEAIWGSMIVGITCALEEERAVLLNSGAPQEALDAQAEMISSLKIGLMGPLAGIGDTINHGLIRPLLLSMFIPLAAAGSWIAGVAPIVIWVIGIATLGYFLLVNGYRSGRKSVVQLLESGKINDFIQVATVLGLFMMGALSSTYVKLATKVSWLNALGEEVFLQSYIDRIFPKLLPFAVVFGLYAYFKKKGTNYIGILVTIIILSLILSFFGIV